MTTGAMPFRPFRRYELAACLALLLVASGCARRGGSHSLTSATPSAERAPLSASRAPVVPPAVVAGQKVYERYCQLCHAKDGTGYAADNAPSLVSQSFLESASDQFIADGIRMGRPNTAMAAYGRERGGPLTEPEIAELVAFLRTKGPKYAPLPEVAVTGDPARGAQSFEKNCQSCHGTATARGNALHLHNPQLLAAASPAFLRYAILQGRAPTPMPAFRDKLGKPEVEDLVAWLVSMKPTEPTAPVRNTQVPDNLPIVINPKGQQAKFTLRDQRFVAADDVKKELDKKRRLVLVDARPPSDWIQFRIPGAVSLPYHDKSQLERIPNDGTWVIAYCACPHHASGEVVDALRKLGYPNTAVLDEGILVWRDRGYPLEGEAATKGPKPFASSSASGKSPSAPAPVRKSAPATKASP